MTVVIESTTKEGENGVDERTVEEAFLDLPFRAQRTIKEEARKTTLQEWKENNPFTEVDAQDARFLSEEDRSRSPFSFDAFEARPLNDVCRTKMEYHSDTDVLAITWPSWLLDPYISTLSNDYAKGYLRNIRNETKKRMKHLRVIVRK